MKLEAYERAHLEALRPYLSECAVLLKRNGDFPLAGPCRLALYGSGARHTIKGGTGSGEVNSRFFVTVEQGLREAGFTITTDSWLDAYDRVLKSAQKAFIRKIKARAREKHTLAAIEGMGAVMPEPEYQIPLKGAGDTAVYVLSRISGEGNDRVFQKGDILLTETECRDILTLQQRYEKFLLILNVGGPVDLSPLAAVENILLMSQLGVESGRAVADLLLGSAYPSGKLTTTWAAAEDDPRIGDFGDPDETRYREGVYVGYRYFDSVGKRARYPFGFGLGYTSFACVNGEVLLEGETATVKTTVQNVGTLPGKETVQVYVSVPGAKLDQPYQTLAAFQKTGELLPGAEEEAVLSFPLSRLSGFDHDAAAYVLEAGDYVIRLGTSSVHTAPCAVLRLRERVTVRQVKNLPGKPDFTDWKPENPRTADLPADVPVLTVDPETIPFQTVSYDNREMIEPAVSRLTTEQLACMNVGAFDPRGGLASVIGSAACSVAGAAGETTRVLTRQGIPAIVMADGPAGIRISAAYARDSKGVHALGPALPESISMFLSPLQRRAVALLAKKPGKDAVTAHQYCTAIPIATAVAQSWNPDFARLCGDLIADEMERFGVHLWLAPALNIHRDIRCGRNFEYFSEDPLLSGVFAAALTAGVQAHPGCGVTVKHFAANNQETNRYRSNSQVSERALREIYLRGFEYCIRASQPAALMTSYNLLNGTHTSERRDLIEEILRSEFGFRGVVMTDWVTTGTIGDSRSVHPAPQAWKVAAAGGDLFMPGSRGDLRSILHAVKRGDLTRAQLLQNASRFYRLAKRLTQQP